MCKQAREVRSRDRLLCGSFIREHEPPEHGPFGLTPGSRSYNFSVLKKMGAKRIVAVAAALAAFGGVVPLAQACSVCLTGADQSTAEAINASVLFLMATPYLVVGSIAGGLFFTYRRAAAQRKAEADDRAAATSWKDKESGL